MNPLDFQKQGLQYLSAPNYEDYVMSRMMSGGLREYWDENLGQMRYAQDDFGNNPIDLQAEFAASTAHLKDADTRFGALLGQVPYTNRSEYWPKLTVWLAQNAPGKVGEWFLDTYNKAASGKPRNSSGEAAHIAKLYQNGTPQERAFMEQYGLNVPEVQQALVSKLSHPEVGIMFTKNKDPLGLKIMRGVTTGLITGGIGAALTPAVGAAASGLGASISGQTASGIAGAGIGAGVNALTGGDPLLGAISGGLGGYYNPEVSGMFGGNSSDVLGGGGGIDNLGFTGSSAVNGTTIPSALETFGYGNLFDSSLAGIPASSMSIGGADVLAGATGMSGLFDLAGDAFSPSNLGQLAVQGGSTFGAEDAVILAKLQDSKLLSEAAKYGVSGLIRYFGSQAALDKALDVAKKLQQQTQFNPYNVTGPAGGATFSGNSVNTYLSPEMQGVANQYKGLSDQYASDISGFSTNDYVSKYLSWMRDISSEYDARNLEQLQSKALNTGMMTGPAGSRLFGEYYKRLNDADLQRQMTAETAGLNRLNTMNSLFNTSSGNYAKLLSSPYGYAELGGTLGGRASAANNAAAQYPWNVAEAQAAGTSGMWGNLASGIGNAVGQYLAPKNTNMSSYF